VAGGFDTPLRALNHRLYRGQADRQTLQKCEFIINHLTQKQKLLPSY
jgi:hypothetical protein